MVNGFGISIWGAKVMAKVCSNVANSVSALHFKQELLSEWDLFRQRHSESIWEYIDWFWKTLLKVQHFKHVGKIEKMRKFHSRLKPNIKNSLHHYKSKTLAEIIDHAKTWELEHAPPKFLERKNGSNQTLFSYPILTLIFIPEKSIDQALIIPRSSPTLHQGHPSSNITCIPNQCL